MRSTSSRMVLRSVIVAAVACAAGSSAEAADDYFTVILPEDDAYIVSGAAYNVEVVCERAFPPGSYLTVQVRRDSDNANGGTGMSPTPTEASTTRPSSR